MQASHSKKRIDNINNVDEIGCQTTRQKAIASWSNPNNLQILKQIFSGTKYLQLTTPHSELAKTGNICHVVFATYLDVSIMPGNF